VIRDPGYADAWAMLAILRLDGGRFGYDGTTEDARSRAFVSARTAAAHALSLEPRNAVAMNALATIEHYSGRFDESLAYSLRAVELNPNDPSTLGYHGWRLVARGRIEEGLPFLHRAIERSAAPLPVFFHMIAVERLMKGDMEGMLTAAQRASVDQSSVSDALLAIAYGGLGLGDKARDALDSMGRKWPLLAQDPATAFGWHNLHPEIVEALVDGLRTAGWKPPQADAGAAPEVWGSGN
jgi:tetratricopeptide (TPR) repeat protein